MRTLRLSLLLSGCALLLACGQEIGDECNSSAECGTGRLCDRASKDGYCTVTPCTVAPNSCPDNSLCVEFVNEQTFCMAGCSEDDDCRDGYECVEHDASDHAYCRER